MIVRAVNFLRCRLALWVEERKFSKSLFLAKLLSPGPDSLIRHRRRHPPPLILPPRSHLIYHQASVDALCARNSLESLAGQIPVEDEVVLLDVGGTMSPEALAPFAQHAWRSYVACATPHPEQRSYTYGLNAVVPGLKAPAFFVWRTDYVYPRGMMADYRRHLEQGAWFAAPYAVFVGKPHVDSAFVRDHWDRFANYDRAFWEPLSYVASLYETQDPALFAMTRKLWDRIGGLNHELWGYGFQFAELAIRVRNRCPARRIAYFGTPPPLHQSHEGSMMYQPADRQQEVQAGIQRFRNFLGGEAAYRMFRLNDRLPPRPPA